MTNGTARSLTELVNDSVETHFRQQAPAIEDSLRTKLEDVQLRMLDGFFRNIQANYAGRIALLEETAKLNNETIAEIQGYSERAENDLQRLADGIRGLIGEA